MPIFLFAAFNITFAAEMAGLDMTAWYTNEYLLRAIIALVFGIKGYALSAVAKGGTGKGMHEGFLHVIIMMALVFAAPIIWPFISPVLPAWAQ